MYSRTEAVEAFLKFYQEILRQPYLDSSALMVPPPNGWDNIRIEGKNETVVDLLRHLPYLRHDSDVMQHIINYETVPICYAGIDAGTTLPEQVHPLPPHCVYLTDGFGAMGSWLILDTDRGTLTEYGRNTHLPIGVPWDEYEALPEAEQWKAHYTAPVTEFLDAWVWRYRRLIWMLVPKRRRWPTTGTFYSRARTWRLEEDLLLAEGDGQLEPWHPEEETGSHGVESAFDRSQRETHAREMRHVANVYNVCLSHGWPDHFEKERCRVELLDLEKKKDDEDRRLMDEENPDASDAE